MTHAAPIAVFHGDKQISQTFECLFSALHCAVEMGVATETPESFIFKPGYMVINIDQPIPPDVIAAAKPQ